MKKILSLVLASIILVSAMFAFASCETPDVDDKDEKEENKEVHEAGTNKRRNISIDSLDELSGVMTEEEHLVAQMMRDNGNSVDFTA